MHLIEEKKLNIKLRNWGSPNFGKKELVGKDQSKLEITVFINNSNESLRGLSDFIAELVAKRGFSDAVEIRTVSSENYDTNLCIIGNSVVRDLTKKTLTEIINQELDKILYSALTAAKRDVF